MLATTAALLMLAAGPADQAAAGPIEPKPGQSWVKVSYEVQDGEAMACTVLDTNIDRATGENVCQTILTNWKFERSKKRTSVTRYVVLKG